MPLQVLAAELLDNHDLLSDACLAQLRRRVWRPFWRRCSTLTRGDRAMGRTEWRLWDPVLEQLGTGSWSGIGFEVLRLRTKNDTEQTVSWKKANNDTNQISLFQYTPYIIIHI